VRRNFRLELQGGRVGKRWRALRPADFDWKLSLKGFSPDELASAQRQWTLASLKEHASASAHALLVRALVRAQAPLDLTALASQLPADELLHAELCARLAGALGGAATVAFDDEAVHPLPADGNPACDAALLSVAACVSETFSHGTLRAEVGGRRPPLVRAVLRRILRDESSHASMAWAALDWALPQLDTANRGRVAAHAAGAIAALERDLARVPSLEPAHFGRLGLPGSVGASGYLTVARETLSTRIRAPLAERGL
jgi:hypothetical protein